MESARNELSAVHENARARTAIAGSLRVDRIQDLGRRIRHLALERYRPSSDEHLLFVNLHAQELFDPQLLDTRDLLRKRASRVVLEVTEHENIENHADLLPRIQALRELGFRIAVDDVGSGYSGLTSIVSLQPEFIKLDMSLVRGIDGSFVRQRIVRAMTSLSRELGTRVIAEGIETEAEYCTLRELGCDWMQGFLLGRPTPEALDVATRVARADVA